MTSPQASRILAVLNEHGRSAPVAPWLVRLESVLTEPTLDDDSIRMLVDRGRPRWGVRSDDDAIGSGRHRGERSDYWVRNMGCRYATRCLWGFSTCGTCGCRAAAPLSSRICTMWCNWDASASATR